MSELIGLFGRKLLFFFTAKKMAGDNRSEYVLRIVKGNVQKSTKVGFGSYLVITLAVWSYCRYNFAQERVKQRQIRKAIQHQLLTEGTEAGSSQQDV